MTTDNIKKVEVLAVVMARGGSVGLPNKALRPLLGRPVLAYTLDHARESKLITRTLVSSDSPEILAIAQSQGVETISPPHGTRNGDQRHRSRLAACNQNAVPPCVRCEHNHRVTEAQRTHRDENRRSTISVRSSALCDSVVKSVLPAAVVMLYGNIPLRANNMIDRAIQMLLDTNADSVQTIAPVGKFHPFWMFDHDRDGRIQKHIPNNIFRRQDLPPLYSPTGAVYVMTTNVLMAAENIQDDPHAFLGADRRGLIVAPEDSVDVDTEKDLYLAEAMLRNSIEPRRHEATKEEK